MEIALYFVIFVLLFATFLVKSERSEFLKRAPKDWILDLASLSMHFFIMPFLQVVLLFELFDYAFPTFKATLEVNYYYAFLYYAFVDYLWYWNHRIFHLNTPLWNYHKVHHAPEYLDPLKTPRNSLLSHFIMVYWWMLGIGIFVSKDPFPLIVVATIGSMINFWGHSKFDLPENWIGSKFIRAIFITPKDHHFHHSQENPRCNFGTVFSIWDRLHGSLHRNGSYPKKYGFAIKEGSLKQLFLP